MAGNPGGGGGVIPRPLPRHTPPFSMSREGVGREARTAAAGGGRCPPARASLVARACAPTNHHA